MMVQERGCKRKEFARRVYLVLPSQDLSQVSGGRVLVGPRICWGQWLAGCVPLVQYILHLGRLILRKTPRKLEVLTSISEGFRFAPVELIYHFLLNSAFASLCLFFLLIYVSGVAQHKSLVFKMKLFPIVFIGSINLHFIDHTSRYCDYSPCGVCLKY